MSVISQINTGRGGRISPDATAFLGKSLTRLTLSIPANVNNETSGMFINAPTGNSAESARRTASLLPEGPIAKVLNAIATEATIVAYDAMPTGTGAVTDGWNVYVEGSFRDTGTTADSNTASLVTRINDNLDDITTVTVTTRDANGTETSHTFADTLFGSGGITIATAGNSNVDDDLPAAQYEYVSADGGNND